MQSLTTIAGNYANVGANLLLLVVMIWLSLQYVRGRSKSLRKGIGLVIAVILLSLIVHAYPDNGTSYFDFLWPSIIIGSVISIWIAAKGTSFKK